MIPIMFIKTVSGAKEPKKAFVTDSGFDLCTPSEFTILPGEVHCAFTGIKIKLPPGWEGQIRPKSGLANRNGITVLNAPGTIDEGYRGEIGVILINHSKVEHTFKAGDMIAQFVPVQRAPGICFVEQHSLDETDRGEGGFGSTGK